MTVRKAVIPAAGLGTRFLPASKSIPKEMIPVVDKPGIQYAVEEAVRAGITDIVVVTSRGKSSIDDHFDFAPDLEAHLAERGKDEELRSVRSVAELADIHFVRQKEPLGFGHAVAVARSHVGNEAFAVLVPDEIVPEPAGDEAPLLERMIETHLHHEVSVVAVQKVEASEISAYGVVAPAPGDWVDAMPITDMVEKPDPAEAPSNLAARGRYVFRPEIFDALDATEPGVGGEIQLTDAIRALAKGGRVWCHLHSGVILDVGRKLDYLKASIHLALRRDDLAGELRDWLRGL